MEADGIMQPTESRREVIWRASGESSGGVTSPRRRPDAHEPSLNIADGLKLEAAGSVQPIKMQLPSSTVYTEW